jgi:hypothetical protein
MVRINEVTSNNPDYVELINIGSTDADISGWVITDDTPDTASHRFTIPDGTIIPAGMILALHSGSGAGQVALPGLGSPMDEVRLYTPNRALLVDMYAWTAAPSGGYSRCPDGTGAFVDRPLTDNAVNNCPATLDP